MIGYELRLKWVERVSYMENLRNSILCRKSISKGFEMRIFRRIFRYRDISIVEKVKE